MTEIIANTFSSHGIDEIYSTELSISSSVRDTIIQTIRDTGDYEGNPEGANTCMTGFDMQTQPGFVELEKEVSEVVAYLPNLMEDPHAHQLPPFEVAVTNMWGLLYTKNDSVSVHAHWPAVWSGVFYLNIPKDYAGTLFFPELEHNIEPITGQLVVFSGHTRHGVETIKSNGERLAVSFNYEAMWSGKRIRRGDEGKIELSI